MSYLKKIETENARLKKTSANVQFQNDIITKAIQKIMKESQYQVRIQSRSYH